MSFLWRLLAGAHRRGWRLRLLAVAACAVPLIVVPAGAASGSPYDHPTSVIWSPTAGSLLTTDTPMIIRGGAVNGEAGGIVSVEISVDGGSTWHLTSPDPVRGREYWSFAFTPTEPGVLTLVSRAATRDVVEVPAHSVTVKVTSDVGGPCPCVMRWPDERAGPNDDPDTLPVEVGLRFRTERDGLVTGLLFYRHRNNVGPFVGHLWSADGDLLATQTLTSSSDGFPYLRFSDPVPIQAQQTYIVSYYTASGRYASTEDYFDSPVVAAPFTTVVDEAGGSGVYTYGDGGGFPDQTWHASNYWVEPVFSTY